MLHRWVVFFHVMSGFVFFLSHGASAFVMLKLPKERAAPRIRALLDLRDFASPAMAWSGGLLFLSGIVAGFTGGLWHWRPGSFWLWGGLLLFILVSIPMGIFGRNYLDRVGKAIGLDLPGSASKTSNAEGPISEKELVTVVESGKTVLVTVSGLVLLALIVWLMMFKPF